MAVRIGRRRFLTRSAATGAGVAVAAMASVGALAKDPPPEDASRGVMGTWLVTVTFTSGSPAPVPPPFQALFTYTAGGGVLETDQTVSSSPNESPVHGSWERLGEGRYRYRCLGFNFNPDGSPFGFSKFTETLTLSRNGSRYSGEGYDALVDNHNAPVFTGYFKTSAERLVID